MKTCNLRDIVGEHMVSLGKTCEKVLVVNADLSGTCRTREFSKHFPIRSFNVGIAEQHLVSFSAGLASEDYIPYIFSMAPFITMRACEQCRTDVAYGNRNVRLLGCYAGVSGGVSGATHWAIEDIGIMTSMPNMTVFEFSDPVQTVRLLNLSVNYDGPIYFRYGINPIECIYDESVHFKIGGACTVINGSDGTFICSGAIVQTAIQASKLLLNNYGLQIRVVDMYSIKPIDRQAIMNAANTGYIVVAQDHNIYGGLGQIVGSVIAEEGLHAKVSILGIKDKFFPMAHTAFLYKQFKLDVEGLCSEMLNLHNIQNTIYKSTDYIVRGGVKLNSCDCAALIPLSNLRSAA